MLYRDTGDSVHYWSTIIRLTKKYYKSGLERTVNKTTAETNQDVAYLLSNNLARLLREFSRDFERRIWQGLKARGYADIRPSHTAVFANLGLGAVRVTELAERAQVTQQAMGKMLKEAINTSIGSEGEKVALLKHKAFREMLGRPGVAIIDFASDSDRLNGSVVSTFPLTEELFYTPRRMSVILNLPFGTLTQRTLIYAVRIHRERPASTNGQIYSLLVDAAESHSKHQARIRLQGHHQWSSRFHRISAGLPNGLAACEVCAESWPGENLVEAAIECVHSWRLSQGHWSAVRAFHPIYGYDMKRGSNGIWYSTGIFGRK